MPNSGQALVEKTDVATNLQPSFFCATPTTLGSCLSVCVVGVFKMLLADLKCVRFDWRTNRVHQVISLVLWCFQWSFSCHVMRALSVLALIFLIHTSSPDSVLLSGSSVHFTPVSMRASTTSCFSSTMAKAIPKGAAMIFSSITFNSWVLYNAWDWGRKNAF